MSAPLPPRSGTPGRADVVAILAAFGERTPDDVPEDVDSMELAWLVHQLEQTYGGTVPEAALVRMTTVSAVVDELAALAEEGVFGAPGSTGPADAPGAAPAPAAGSGGTAAQGQSGDAPAASGGASRTAAAPAAGLGGTAAAPAAGLAAGRGAGGGDG